MVDNPQLTDAAAVCDEYGPSRATAVNRHNDICRATLAAWVRRRGCVVEVAPDGQATLSVRCVNAVGEETLARAYTGTETECMKAAEDLRKWRAGDE